MSGTNSNSPTVVSSAGILPLLPADLRAFLVALVAQSNPDYTANLPGALIEDIASTDTQALVTMYSLLIDLVNSLVPASANVALLNQIGNTYGIPDQSDSYTSVYVVFSSPSPGFSIPSGFIVSDGTYQYILQEATVIGTNGTSPLAYCLASTSGSWAIPIGTVISLGTSVQSGITLTVTNPVAGLPGGTAETSNAYRARLLTAIQAPAQGMPTYLRTLLAAISGVQSNLIAIKKVSGGGWKIIVGGGDPYAIALAIYQCVFDLSTLHGSTIKITQLTNANPGVVTTDLNHGLQTGQTIELATVGGMTALDGIPLVSTVLTEKTFSIGVSTTSY